MDDQKRVQRHILLDNEVDERLKLVKQAVGVPVSRLVESAVIRLAVEHGFAWPLSIEKIVDHNFVIAKLKNHYWGGRWK